MHRPELRSLTSLRGLAAAAVVLQHFSATAARATLADIPSLAPHGYMAVDFFFVLSGFIMGYTYLAAFEAEGLRVYLPFLAKRVARIAPLGAVVTLAILCCGAVASWWGAEGLFIPEHLGGGVLAAAVLINLAHLQGFIPGSSLNGPSWSVSMECAAYVAFPGFVAVFCRRRRWSGGAAGAVCVLILVLLASAPGGLAARGLTADSLRLLAEFGLGLLTYRVFRAPGACGALGRDGATGAVTAVVVAAALWRCDLLIVLACPPLVLAYALNRGLPSRIMAKPALHWLGTVSFSLYLIHNILRDPALALLRWAHPAPVSGPAALAFALAGSLAVLPLAALTYRAVERPGRAVVNYALWRISHPRPSTAPVA